MKKITGIVVLTFIIGILFTVTPKKETQSNDHSLVTLQEATDANAEIIIGPICMNVTMHICFVEPDGWGVFGYIVG